MKPADDKEQVLFREALQRAKGAEREDYLDQVCAGNAALRARLAALLQAHESPDPFLEPPAGDFLKELVIPLSQQTTALLDPVTEKPGDKIGHYKLLQQIGEGGCGVVYMAEQEEPIRRRVALKVIKLGMDTKQVVARFEAERQALALMDHPNIAKVLDAGATDTGRPYFVMELVRGIKITDYCDENHLSTEERLDLFVQICHAIQHAHQKGIIHRDIKPSNILVTVHDGKPLPKIIDFGIAKATTGQPLTDKTVFTAFEQFIGTPAYMSPEQAEMSTLDIDTRSDIYSLGVLLYELLTGKTPFDSRRLLEAGLDEIRRIIREEEPPRPSTRLRTLAAEEQTTTAIRRHTGASQLIQLVRGDLDWIAMKALDKNRTRRYETANALALDIERHLDDEPVEAHAPSQFYRLQKLIRRHKLTFVAAAVMFAALAIGLGVSLSSLHKANREATRSQQVAEFLQDMLQGVGPSVARGRDTTMLREILDKTAQRLDKELKNQPDVEADLRNTIGTIYFELGQYTNAEAMFRGALAVRKKLLGNEHPKVADSLCRLGGVLYREGKFAEAETLCRQALAMQRKLLGSENKDVADSLNNLAAALSSEGKWAETETLTREALALRKKLLGSEHPDVANSLDGLALVLSSQGKYVEAETLYREALALQRKLLGIEHRDVANSLNGLAYVLSSEGKWAEAETLYREALAMQRKLLGSEHRDVANSLNGLAYVLSSQGKLTEAETLYREALAMQRKLLGIEHPDVAWSLNSLVDVLMRERKFDEAEQLLDDLLTPAAERQPKSAGLLRARGNLRARTGHWKEAAADFSRVVEFEPEDPEAYRLLAPLLVQSGDLEGYRRHCARIVARFGGTNDPVIAERMAKDCLILPSPGADLTAESNWANTAVTEGKNHPYLVFFQFVKGLAEYRQGHFATAVEWTQKVLAQTGEVPFRDVEAYMVLAMARYQSRQPDQARAGLAKGVEIAETKLPKVDSGDFGDDWLDWIIAHALMSEAKAVLGTQPATPERDSK